jgi:thiol-disulfide isomerase/thioredoxin
MNSRTRLMLLFATIAAVVAVVVLYGIGFMDVHATAAPPAVLNRLKLTNSEPAAPEIGFVDAQGKKFSLADFKGRYVLVNLWATWCGPCINELPELARLQQALPQDRFTVVPVDVLERVNADQLRSFLDMHSAQSLPVYVDQERKTQQGFVANELPLTVLIDSSGHEIARAAGGQKWADPASIAWMKSISAPPSKP